MSNRKRAFSRPRPIGWRPRYGERVYLRPVAGTLGRLVGAGFVRAATTDPEYFRVLVRYGRQQSCDLWSIEDLRPAPDCPACRVD